VHASRNPGAHTRTIRLGHVGVVERRNGSREAYSLPDEEKG